jgi:hypothetical protein
MDLLVSQFVLILTHICDLCIKAAHLSNEISYDGISWRCGADFLHSAGGIKPGNDCGSIDPCSPLYRISYIAYLVLLLHGGLWFCVS